MSMVPAETHGQDLVQRTPQQELFSVVRSDSFQKQIEMALPGNVTPERFVRTTVTAIMQEPKLAHVDRDSFFASVIRCATDGLLPDGKEAALVIFGQKATYMPMVGGYRRIAAEYGWTLRAYVVFENDEFDYELGLEPRLIHKPAKLGTDRGNRVAAVAVARHRDGRTEFDVMTADEVEKVRGVSRSKDRGPWVDFPNAMWEKSVARRLFADLPLDPGDRRIASLIEVPEEPGAAANLLYGPGGDAYVAREIQGTPDGNPADDHDEQAAYKEVAEVVVDQQAGDGVAQPLGDPAAAPGEPDLEPVEGFPIPHAVIEAALAAVVPSGKAQGRSLAQIASARHGKEWLQHAVLEPSPEWPEEFRAQVSIVYRARVGGAS